MQADLITETEKVVKPMTVVLIDLSSLAYPIWHMAASESNPDYASIQIVKRVRELASGQDHVAICADSGRSFRNDLAATYKANRGERNAPLMHQIDVALEKLAGDGFPIWKVKGYEADDVIATAALRASDFPDSSVLIVSVDKDLMQLVGPCVTVKSSRTGDLFDEAGVVAKFGVRADQIRDYLTLLGDTADNVPGAAGIGAVRAKELLNKFESIDNIYKLLEETGQMQMKLTPAIAKSLRDFKEKMPLTRELITLKPDAPIAFEDVLKERVLAPTPNAPSFTFEEEEEESMHTEQTQPPSFVDLVEGHVITEPDPSTPEQKNQDNIQAPPASPTQATRKTETALVAPAPQQWERQLDPRSLAQAQQLSRELLASRMFSGYGNAEAVLSTILVGRELGIPALTSLRTIHNIQGKHALSAQLVVALVLRSGLCDFFELIELDDKHCVYETKRKKSRKAVKLEHTIEMAEQAGLLKPGSNWLKIPSDMLNARCSIRLARIVYPDICANVLSKEELEEINSAA